MRKQTIHTDPPPECRTMGLRWGAVRRHTPSTRNDHIHLFSTENNARHMRAALRQVEEGRVYRMSLEEICARFGPGGGYLMQAIAHSKHPSKGVEPWMG